RRGFARRRPRSRPGALPRRGDGPSLSVYSRRSFLRASGGALAVSLLVACAPSAPAPSATSAPASNAGSPAAQLPTYVPFQGPKPDFASSADGVVPAGYLTFPKDLAKSSSGPVGKQGDSV